MDPMKKKIKIIDLAKFDYLISLSKKLIKFESKKKNFILISHGLSHYFSNYKSKLLNKNNSKIIIGLYGNFLSGRFDFKLIDKIIKLNPNFRFYFFGNKNISHPYIDQKRKYKISMEIDKIKYYSNVKFFENLSHTILPKNLDICDLFIYPSKLKKNIDAHKLLELIYLGKPIITEKFINYNKTKDLIYHPKKYSAESYSLKINQIIKKYTFYTSAKLITKRKKFSLKKKYKELINEILKKIDE